MHVQKGGRRNFKLNVTGVVRLSMPLEIKVAPQEEGNLNHSIRAERRSPADCSTFQRGLVYLAADPEGRAREVRYARAPISCPAEATAIERASRSHSKAHFDSKRGLPASGSTTTRPNAPKCNNYYTLGTGACPGSCCHLNQKESFLF